jgi:hypothetical protein
MDKQRNAAAFCLSCDRRAWCEVAWQMHRDTALLLSCWNRHVDIVRLLLDRPDVDVNAASVSGAGGR